MDSDGSNQFRRLSAEDDEMYLKPGSSQNLVSFIFYVVETFFCEFLRFDCTNWSFHIFSSSEHPFNQQNMVEWNSTSATTTSSSSPEKGSAPRFSKEVLKTIVFPKPIGLWWWNEEISRFQDNLYIPTSATHANLPPNVSLYTRHEWI